MPFSRFDHTFFPLFQIMTISSRLYIVREVMITGSLAGVLFMTLVFVIVSAPMSMFVGHISLSYSITNNEMTERMDVILLLWLH